jgi:hypothetical protein
MKRVIAHYLIPLGGSEEVALTFTGESLTAADFDALEDFVQFARRQCERSNAPVQTWAGPRINEESK